MMLASTKKAPVSVFLGSAVALVLNSFLGVMVGNTVYKFIPAGVIRVAAGAGFLVIGALILLGKV